jgi:hypothetical protein
MPGGVPGRGSHIRWAKPVSTKKMRSYPEQAYSVGGLMGPIPGFHSRGRKRGTCPRGAGVGSRAEGQRSPAAGQAVLTVVPGRGRRRAVTGGRWVGGWPTEVQGQLRPAAIGKNVWRHARGRLLLPRTYCTSLDLSPGPFPGRRFRLGAWAWAQRGGGSPRRGGSGDGAGVIAVGPRAGVMAGPG